jgi:hypothetical protein
MCTCVCICTCVCVRVCACVHVLACACARKKCCCYVPGLFNDAVLLIEESRVKLCNKKFTYEESEGKAENLVIDALIVL